MSNNLNKDLMQYCVGDIKLAEYLERWKEAYKTAKVWKLNEERNKLLK